MNKKNLSGFTLIELMVTLAVVIVVGAVAVPAFMATIRDNRLVANVNEMAHALAYARSEAVRLRGNVTVCASSDGATCSGAATWENGWIILGDLDADGADDLMKAWPALGGDDTVRAHNGATALVFDASGAVNAPVSLVFCNEEGASEARAVNVLAIGRVRAAAHEGAGSDDVVDTVDGADVTCP